jgi:hypothetical protein
VASVSKNGAGKPISADQGLLAPFFAFWALSVRKICQALGVFAMNAYGLIIGTGKPATARGRTKTVASNVFRLFLGRH